MTRFPDSVWLLAILPAALLAFSAAPARADDEYEARGFKAGDQKLPYRLLKPEAYDPQKKYPLVVFLHGAGERGDDNKLQLKHVLPIFATKESREKYPCFVLAPQCPAEQKWSEVDWGAKSSEQPKQPSAPMTLTLKAIAALEKEFSIDPARLYIIGLSMGGYGTWDVIVRHPEMFAAAVPICGGGDETKADAIAKLPIWVFHGAKDPAVSVERSRNMVAALKKAGGSPKYTEYPDAGHDSWVPASKDPDLLPWLFSQKR
jgi:predicted peptidase